MTKNEAYSKAYAQKDQDTVLIVLDEDLIETKGRSEGYRVVTEDQFDEDRRCGQFYRFFDQVDNAQAPTVQPVDAACSEGGGA